MQMIGQSRVGCLLTFRYVIYSLSFVSFRLFGILSSDPVQALVQHKCVSSLQFLIFALLRLYTVELFRDLENIRSRFALQLLFLLHATTVMQVWRHFALDRYIL